MAKYIATLRAVFDADDDVDAIFIADQIRVNGAVDLDNDAGDSIDVTQVTSNTLDIRPEEVLNQLRRSRNLLIRTRIKECFELARELDKTIHALSRNEQWETVQGHYDWSEFLTLAKRILQGESPDA